MAKEWPGHYIRVSQPLWDLFGAAVLSADPELSRTTALRGFIRWYCGVAALPAQPRAAALAELRKTLVDQDGVCHDR